MNATLPTRSEMERASTRRDRSYDGLFFLAVKTTGIFCRPSCPAKKPRPENVDYFGSAREALFAGFRIGPPCTEADVHRAEAALGETFPPPLRACYLAFDGFIGPTDARFLWPLFGYPGLVRSNQFYRGDDLFLDLVHIRPGLARTGADRITAGPESRERLGDGAAVVGPAVVPVDHHLAAGHVHGVTHRVERRTHLPGSGIQLPEPVAVEDATGDHRRLVVAAWGRVAVQLSARGREGLASPALLLAEAELWRARIAAIDAGALVVVRLLAEAPIDTD